MCLRDLGQIYGSIEAQHQRTILVDFIDHLADFDRFGRADQLFAKDKTIGAPMISLHAVPDLPKAVQDHLYFVRFEDLIEKPAACMSHIYAWLGLSSFNINPEKLALMGPPESDSHYRMKYLHTQSARVVKPKRHEIPPRIQTQIDVYKRQPLYRQRPPRRRDRPQRPSAPRRRPGRERAEFGP